MIKYFIYCRKSSEEEERQMLSIEAQVTELREYAKNNGLFVAKEFHESKTAKEPGRGVFNEMLAEIEKGNASGILAWNPDRLARNSVDGGKVIYLVDTGKIESLKFPTFWFEGTPQGKFMLSENGEKLSKPEHEFLAYWLNLLEYHAPKLARVENKIEGKLEVNLVNEFEEVKKQ
ncbi:MAG: recombinase family protein [Nanoarchaeota archaeon]